MKKKLINKKNKDARKGVIFESLPPVLQLQLKRFEYDIERDAMVKVRKYIIELYVMLEVKFKVLLFILFSSLNLRLMIVLNSPIQLI